MRYYWVGSNADPLELAGDGLFDEKQVCRKCGIPFDGDPIDVRVKTEPRGEAFAWSYKVAVSILSTEFCRALGYPGSFSGLSTGRLLATNGSVIDGYITVNSSVRFFIRGSKAPRLGPTCSSCGRFFAYTPQGGPLYILDSKLMRNRNLVLLQGTTLLISREIIERANIKSFKKIVLEDSDVRVFDEAKDGYANSVFPPIVLQKSGD